jgi:hypothetical protein
MASEDFAQLGYDGLYVVASAYASLVKIYSVHIDSCQCYLLSLSRDFGFFLGGFFFSPQVFAVLMSARRIQGQEAKGVHRGNKTTTH